jgi:chromosome segregation ATPase
LEAKIKDLNARKNSLEDKRKVNEESINEIEQKKKALAQQALEKKEEYKTTRSPALRSIIENEIRSILDERESLEVRLKICRANIDKIIRLIAHIEKIYPR